MFSNFFGSKQGVVWWGFIFGALVFSAVVIGILHALPQPSRKYIIRAVTFLGGLFFVVEFFWPVHPSPGDPTHQENFLTHYIVPFGNFSAVVGAWTVGLGLFSLIEIHGKRILKGSSDAINSLVFFLSMIAMALVGILQKAHPNAINKNLYSLLFDGGLQSMDATMFSIIAFYIVSAAYRAFRVRSIEATLLLVTALLVMMGQISVGYVLTNWLPHAGLLHNFRAEIIRDWILTKAQVPAVRAISFGLGVGGLAFALRIWLGLERSGYFDKQS